MMFDQIEKLKQEFTDKYVVVNVQRPELARFEGQTGQVKTVNMNGRALVQFDAWNNIGWYDIDPGYLTVVPKPEPKADVEKPVKAAATKEKTSPAAANTKEQVIGEKKLSPIEMARQQGAAKAAPPPATGAPGKLSTADILAAARAKKAAEASGATSAPKASPTPKPTGEAGGTAASPTKLSTAEILAAARTKKAAENNPLTEPVVTERPAPNTPQEPQAASAGQPLPASKGGPLPTATAERIAWCREHDRK